MTKRIEITMSGDDETIAARVDMPDAMVIPVLMNVVQQIASSFAKNHDCGNNECHVTEHSKFALMLSNQFEEMIKRHVDSHEE